MTLFVVLLLTVQIVLPVSFYLGRNRLIFLPSPTPAPEEGLRFLQGLADVRLVAIERSDGRRLAAYDARPLERPDAEPVVLFFHGNAGNIAHRAPLVERLAAETGLRTVLFDYSGYGGNAGSPSEQEAYRDGLAAFDHLVAQGVGNERIVLYGESLGGAIALAVATERQCGGIVLQSTFSSLSSMSRQLYPWLPLTSLLARGAFPSAERVAEITEPVLVVHGNRDRIVPISEGRRLHAAAAPDSEFLEIEGADHNDFFAVAGREYLRDLGARVAEWTKSDHF